MMDCVGQWSNFPSMSMHVVSRDRYSFFCFAYNRQQGSFAFLWQKFHLVYYEINWIGYPSAVKNKQSGTDLIRDLGPVFPYYFLKNSINFTATNNTPVSCSRQTLFEQLLLRVPHCLTIRKVASTSVVHLPPCNRHPSWLISRSNSNSWSLKISSSCSFRCWSSRHLLVSLCCSEKVQEDVLSICDFQEEISPPADWDLLVYLALQVEMT